jgi:hypothetical protein
MNVTENAGHAAAGRSSERHTRLRQLQRRVSREITIGAAREDRHRHLLDAGVPHREEQHRHIIQREIGLRTRTMHRTFVTGRTANLTSRRHTRTVRCWAVAAHDRQARAEGAAGIFGERAHDWPPEPWRGQRRHRERPGAMGDGRRGPHGVRGGWAVRVPYLRPSRRMTTGSTLSRDSSSAHLVAVGGRIGPRTKSPCPRVGFWVTRVE